MDEGMFVPPVNVDISNENIGSTEKAGSGGAERGNQGVPKNSSGQTVYKIGNTTATSTGIQKATKALKDATMKKIKDLIAEGKFHEAIDLAEKVLGLKLEDVLKFAVNKGVIPEEKVINGVEPVVVETGKSSASA